MTLVYGLVALANIFVGFETALCLWSPLYLHMLCRFSGAWEGRLGALLALAGAANFNGGILLCRNRPEWRAVLATSGILWLAFAVTLAWLHLPNYLAIPTLPLAGVNLALACWDRRQNGKEKQQ